MLDTTMTTKFVVGTNLKGNVTGANWSFLLPRLELNQIICLGVPPTATLSTLVRLGRRVVVICGSLRQLDKIRTMSQRNKLNDVCFLVASSHGVLPLPSNSTDLILAGRKEAQQLYQNSALKSELRRLLKPDGLAYFEFGGPLDWLQGSKVMNHLAGESGLSSLFFWLTPLTGEMQTAVPLHDRETTDYFLQNRLYSPSLKLPLVTRAERIFSQHRLFGQFSRRYGALIGPDTSNLTHQPPQYLQSLAWRAGIDISNYRWGLSARGKYNTRKVLFFLFEPATSSPKYLIKMTRNPAFNYRLENEYRAICYLREKGIGNPETVPQPVFLDYHNNLAIVGESVIQGKPFRQQTSATADCPYSRGAIDWLTNLGAATADLTSATPTQVAGQLNRLFDQFLEVYSLTPEQQAFMKRQIAAVEQSSSAFPLVFQHGDPGIWNIVVTPQGQIAFLDWEAFEPKGMPLWDLFYLLRSYAAWLARSRGVRDSIQGFNQQFLAESSFSRVVIQAVRRYREQTNLPTHLVKPLFYTCWMHRALKQATILSPAKLESGHYIRLLRLCIDQQNAFTLRHLFPE